MGPTTETGIEKEDMRKLNRFLLKSGAALPLALLAIASPEAAIAATQLSAAAPSASNPVDRAMDSAGIGDLGPIDTLLEGDGLTAAERLLLEAQRAAALLRDGEAAEAIERYLMSGEASAERRLRAHSIAAGSAFAAGDYRRASDHAAQYLAAATPEPARKVEGMRRLKQIADLLSAAPRQRLEHGAKGQPSAIIRDKVGLLRTTIRVGSAQEQAVIDTGANMSVASRSAARRMGLKMIEGAASVGNSLGSGVDVRLAIAERLEIAGAVLHNSVFLVMDDEALTFPLPGGYRIDTIIGLPALRAMGRLRFGPGDKLQVEAAAPARPGASNLRVLGSDPYAVVKVSGRQHSLFFDTGANSSSVSARLVSEHPELEMIEAGSATRAGAGKSAEVRKIRLNDVPLGIGNAEAVAKSMNVEADPAPGDEDRYGVLGADLFRLFDTVIIDFGSMRLEAYGED